VGKQRFMINQPSLNKFIFLGCLALCTLTHKSIFGQQVIDKVVAVVGENIILHSDIEEQIDQMSISDVRVTPNTRCKLVEDLMYQKLFVNRAKADSLEVTDEQIEQELNRRLRYFISQIGSEEELVKFYGKTLDEIKADFRDDVKEILLIQQMQQKVVGEVKVSPLEVREFLASIPKDSIPYINAAARIAQIVILPPISKEEEKALVAQLRDFKRRVNEGEDFGTLAYLYSKDPGSAESNGELGFMSSSELVAEFANAATGLQKGEMSDVVKTQFGYHLIQMIDRKGERINVRHILLIPQVSLRDLQKAKIVLDSLKNQIESVDTLTFAKAAVKFSTDKETRMNGGEMINPADGTNLFDMETVGQYDRNLLFTIQKLKVGEVSQSELFQTQDGKRAYRLVKLEEMTKPHVANINNDYSRLQESAKRKKENTKLEEWINENKDSAYIWVDTAYATCPFATNWKLAAR
jgi:peptidyl-prolyl cis-trans isomerase SurA